MRETAIGDVRSNFPSECMRWCSGQILLSNQYIAATNEAQRLALATAATGIMAIANAIVGVGILTALGILILSSLLLCSKGVAYVGIATGTIGIVSEALRDLIGLGCIIYGLLLLIWFILVGWSLYRLGWRSIAYH
jgi:hypothetical protein